MLHATCSCVSHRSEIRQHRGAARAVAKRHGFPQRGAAAVVFVCFAHNLAAYEVVGLIVENNVSGNRDKARIVIVDIGAHVCIADTGEGTAVWDSGRDDFFSDDAPRHIGGERSAALLETMNFLRAKHAKEANMRTKAGMMVQKRAPSKTRLGFLFPLETGGEQAVGVIICCLPRRAANAVVV